MARSFKRPDEAAMQRVFARTSGGAAEVVLRLAWLQGLHRAEITALRWDQVDFAGRALLLPDRTIPLDPSAEACLRTWYVRCAGNPECVAVSDRDQTPMRPESVSRLARQALNSEGLALSLLDLRRDFILRQIEAHGWSYAAQVSGVAAAALREEFLPRLRAANTLPEAPKVGRDEREYLLWRIIQQEGSSPAGLALWMGWQLRMQPGEIAALTWDQVDFDRNLLLLPDREVPMGSRLRRMLSEAKERRKDPAEPQVFTAPTTGRPMDLARLTTVTRTALIRGGLEQVNLRNLHTWATQDDRSKILLDLAAQQGYLTREDVTAALNVSKATARQQLLRLRKVGQLVRVGARYYPAGAVADPDDHLDIIRAYLQEHGTGRRQDFIRLLGLEPEQGTLLLRRLTDRGELVLTGRHYTLPEQEK